MQKQRLEAAAEVGNESISQFVLGAATREADRILGEGQVQVLPAEQFDALLAALDEPATEMPNLAEAARKKRRYRRAAR